MVQPAEQIVPHGGAPPPVVGVARAAGIVSLGNVASRLLGMAREFVKADLFGVTGLVSAFEVANVVPKMMFELLVGGMISSALIPVMSDYVRSDREGQEFWRLASTLLSVAAVLLAALVALAEPLAGQITWLLGARNFDDPTLWPVAARLLRLMLPAVLFLNISGLLAGTLYSLKRFTIPAFVAAAFNASVTIAAMLRPDRIDSLAWGVLAGSLLQVLMQLPALRPGRVRWSWDLRHPALRRMVRLYLPIALGVLVSQAAITISYNLATQTGDESLAIMGYATTLIQFPLGLVATAVSVAILPTLSRKAATAEGGQATLAQGLRLVLILIIPATAGLFILARPVVALAFEHGDFSPADTETTAQVLRFFLFGLPFAAVDQLLIFAFYARKNTITPALVGVLSVGVYLVVAVSLLRTMGLLSLMIADSVKHMTHAGVMTLLLHRQLGDIHDSIRPTLGKAILATSVMAAIVWSFSQAIPFSAALFSRLAQVVGGGGIGLVTYLVVLDRLGVPEVRTVWAATLGKRTRNQ